MAATLLIDSTSHLEKLETVVLVNDSVSIGTKADVHRYKIVLQSACCLPGADIQYLVES